MTPQTTQKKNNRGRITIASQPHNIRITIVEVRGDKVRIGIDAPRDVAVHRQEIYDAIRRDAEKAAHPI